VLSNKGQLHDGTKENIRIFRYDLVGVKEGDEKCSLQLLNN
jgi:hypothetical protein